MTNFLRPIRIEGNRTGASGVQTGVGANRLIPIGGLTETGRGTTEGANGE